MTCNTTLYVHYVVQVQIKGMAEEKIKEVLWYQIQEKVFTRWCNTHLAKRGQAVERLQTDLSDGVLLIQLLEVLSEKKLGKYNKNPVITIQKWENLSIALAFLKTEGIYVVNMGPADIQGGNLRIILGLIWTLIQHYSISLQRKQAAADKEQKEKDSLANDLIKWIQSKIPEYNITNLTKDWNDGRAVCALTNAIATGSVPDHKDKDPHSAYDNAKVGIDTAEQKLGIAQLIMPEEMIHPKVDKNGMTAYLAQFRVKSDQLDAEMAARQAAARELQEEEDARRKVEEERRRVEEEARRKRHEEEMLKLAEEERLKAEALERQRREEEEARRKAEEEKRRVEEEAARKKREEEERERMLAEQARRAELEACRAYGDGLSAGIAAVPAHFKLEIPANTKRQWALSIKNEQGEEVKYVKLDNGDGKFDITYTPTKPGVHDIAITLGGDDIPGSVFHPLIDPEIYLGGVIRVYYTTTTASALTRGWQDRLEWLFFVKKVHLRPDFEPWIAVDMISKKERDKVYAKAGSKKLPLVFINDRFIGSWEEIEDMNETGELEDLLKLPEGMVLMTEAEHLARMGLLGGEEDGERKRRTHYCGDCGNPRLIDNKFCPDCGSENPVEINKDNANKIKWFTAFKAKPADPDRVAGDVKGRLAMFEVDEEASHVEVTRTGKIPTFKKDEITMDQVLIAASMGDLDAIKGMSYAGYDLNTKDEDGKTAAQVALENGHPELIKFLKEKGAKMPPPNTTDFFIACADGFLPKVQAHVFAGQDVNIFDEQGMTPYLIANEEDHQDVVSFLLAQGAQAVSDFMNLFMAIDEGKLDEVKRIVEEGKMDLNSVDEDGNSPLDIANQSNDENADKAAIVALLVGKGAKTGEVLREHTDKYKEAAAKKAEWQSKRAAQHAAEEPKA
eukprot:g34059.t1